MVRRRSAPGRRPSRAGGSRAGAGCATCPGAGPGAAVQPVEQRGHRQDSRPAPARQRVEAGVGVSPCGVTSTTRPGCQRACAITCPAGVERLRRPASATPCSSKPATTERGCSSPLPSTRSASWRRASRRAAAACRPAAMQARLRGQRQREGATLGHLRAAAPVRRERFSGRARSQIHPQPGERGAQHVVAGVARLGFAPDAAGLVVLPRHPEHLARGGRRSRRRAARGRPAAAGAAPRRGCRGGTRPSPGCR